MTTTQVPPIYETAGLDTTARFMLFWDTDRVEVFSKDGESLGIVTERDLIRALAKEPHVEVLHLVDLLPWMD